jgi:hypothetical protein
MADERYMGAPGWAWSSRLPGAGAVPPPGLCAATQIEGVLIWSMPHGSPGRAARSVRPEEARAPDVAACFHDQLRVVAGVTVSETGRCPHCGSVPGAKDAGAAPEPGGPARAGLEPLYREVRRIREIAEAHDADHDARRIAGARSADDDARRIADAGSAEDARRIAELTRQIHELRATVARLRGTGETARPVGTAMSGRSAR